MVTDRITRFTTDGILLESGEELPADIVVTATGLAVQPVGGMRLTVDGEQVDLSTTVSYKGMMLSGVPNFDMVFGYTNASWTLKADLVNRYMCRVLNHMAAKGYDVALPVAPPEGPAAPFLDLTSGYVQRSLAESGLEPLKESPEQFGVRMRRDYERFRDIVKAAKLKPE